MKTNKIKHNFDNLIVGLVGFKVGTWREVMQMDIEDAINTFCIHYINRVNENLAYDEVKNKKRV